jgi:hypothetical protein
MASRAKTALASGTMAQVSTTFHEFIRTFYDKCLCTNSWIKRKKGKLVNFNTGNLGVIYKFPDLVSCAPVHRQHASGWRSIRNYLPTTDTDTVLIGYKE